MRSTTASRLLIPLICAALVLPAASLEAQEPQALWNQGRAALESGDWREANRLLRAALDAGGEAYERWFWLRLYLGVTASHLQRYDDAISELQLAQELAAQDQELFQAHHALAQVYLTRGNSGDYDRVVAAETEAAKYASGQQRALVEKTLGQAYYFKEDWGKTIEHLQPAAEARPDEAVVQAMLGRAYFETGRTDQAMDALQAALSSDRNNLRALIYLTRIHLDRRNYDDAKQMAERGLSVDPQNGTLRNLAGRAYLGSGDYQQAIRAFDQVIQGDIGSKGPAYYNQGQAYAALEQWPEAIRAYQNAVQNLTAGSATLAECLYDLGFALEKAELYEDALAALEDSAEIRTSEKVTEAIERVKERIRRQKEQ